MRNGDRLDRLRRRIEEPCYFIYDTLVDLERVFLVVLLLPFLPVSLEVLRELWSPGESIDITFRAPTFVPCRISLVHRHAGSIFPPRPPISAASFRKTDPL